MGYAQIYKSWADDPERFWLTAANGIDWVTKPAKALDASRAPLYEWFTDATVNTCWNAVDRHVVAGRGAQPAIIHDSPVTGTAISTMSDPDTASNADSAAWSMTPMRLAFSVVEGDLL